MKKRTTLQLCMSISLLLLFLSGPSAVQDVKGSPTEQQALLIFTLSDVTAGRPVDDHSGNWQYVTAVATNHGGTKWQLTAMKRFNSGIAGGVKLPASMLTGTVMYSTPTGAPPEFITFQGVHDLTTTREWGNITSTSPQFHSYAGGTFTFDANNNNMLVITAP